MNENALDMKIDRSIPFSSTSFSMLSTKSLVTNTESSPMSVKSVKVVKKVAERTDLSPTLSM